MDGLATASHTQSDTGTRLSLRPPPEISFPMMEERITSSGQLRSQCALHYSAFSPMVSAMWQCLRLCHLALNNNMPKPGF